MKIITVCGSLRFKKEMLMITEKMELEGNCMLSAIYPVNPNKDAYTEEEAQVLDEMHKEKIKLSDAILVVNVNNYIGKSTKSEIEYAKSLNKEIIYYTDINLPKVKNNNKNFVLILLFTKDLKQLLLVKRNKSPYKNCWNGIGGKIEGDETPIEAAIRECYEETHIPINPKLLLTNVYPEDNPLNSNTKLNVLYDFVDKKEVIDNYEGHYEWKSIDFVMDATRKDIAGLSNINQFVKEIFDLENINKFYD